MTQICKICLSPYRDELVKAWKNHFPRKLLWEKYGAKIWGKKVPTFESFAQALMRHGQHNPPGVVVVGESATARKDTMGIAKMITELYAKKVEGMTPDDITTKDYVAVNKLLIEEKKLKLDQNEQMMALASLFGVPEILSGVAVDPTVVPSTIPSAVVGEEEHVRLGPQEDIGNQP